MRSSIGWAQYVDLVLRSPHRTTWRAVVVAHTPYALWCAFGTEHILTSPRIITQKRVISRYFFADIFVLVRSMQDTWNTPDLDDR